MTENRTPVSRILSPLEEGRVQAGSEKGRALIQEALARDPDETVRIMRPIDPSALREGMRSAAFSEERIAELIRTPNLDGRAADPFTPAPAPEDPTPFPDPAELIRRGPTPFR